MTAWADGDTTERRRGMRVAFTTSGDTQEAPLDSRFGRAPKFLIYDTESRTFDIIDNRENLNAAHGAGIQAAEAVARSGVEGLVTGHCGPRAFQVLAAAGIKVYQTDAPTVGAALKAFEAGKLKPAASADVGGHWV